MIPNRSEVWRYDFWTDLNFSNMGGSRVRSEILTIDYFPAQVSLSIENVFQKISAIAGVYFEIEPFA